MLHSLLVDVPGVLGLCVGSVWVVNNVRFKYAAKRKLNKVLEAKNAALTVLLTHIEEFHEEWVWGEYYFEHKKTKLKLWIANGWKQLTVDGPGLKLEQGDLSEAWKRQLWSAMKGETKSYRRLVEVLKPPHLKLDHEGDRPDPEPYRLVHFA